MEAESIALLGLTSLNVFQLVFWSIQNRKLVDRLMSRNYAEYVQTEQLTKASPAETRQTQDTPFDDPDLRELNARLGDISL